MVNMTVEPEVLGLPRGRALTRADLDRMPDDGHRYELIDGVLIVSPAPSPRHQRALASLYLMVHAACPSQLEVLFAPLDVALADDTVMQPDLLVAARSDFTERDLPTAPLLAVEILSPSTRRFDLSVKKSRLEAAGCAFYWVIDPMEPSISCWELVDGSYQLVGQADDSEELRLERPFEISIVPGSLID